MGFFHIKNIDDVLSTGSLPTDRKHIDELKKEGFSTIVSLESLSTNLVNYATSQGLKVETLPVGWHKAIPPEKIKRFLFLAAIAEAKKEKIFLHCLQGRDRTGEMTAAYMIAKKAWERSGELRLEGPLRLFVKGTMEGMQNHFEKTLKRATLKYRPESVTRHRPRLPP